MADDNEEREKQAVQDEAAEAALAKAAAIDENASFGIEEGEVNKIAPISHRPPTCFILFRVRTGRRPREKVEYLVLRRGGK
mgnify:CR=1 FL=1